MRRKGRERLPEPRGPEGAEGKGLRSPTRGGRLCSRGSLSGAWRDSRRNGDRGEGVGGMLPSTLALSLGPGVSAPRSLPRVCWRVHGSVSHPLCGSCSLPGCCLWPCSVRPTELPAGAACRLPGSLALTLDLGLSWDHAPSCFHPAWLSAFLPFLLSISLIQFVRL